MAKYVNELFLKEISISLLSLIPQPTISNNSATLFQSILDKLGFNEI